MEIVFLLAGISFALVLAYMAGHWIGFSAGENDYAQRAEEIRRMNRSNKDNG